jgi:hypothetical protein
VDGDILIVSAFTKGGNVSTITAFRWNGGAGGSLGTTPVAGGGDCRDANQALGDPICATANTADLTGVPWLTNFNGKPNGLDNKLLTGEFFEGGINLTDTNLAGKCFNTFVGDTRSSQQLTATLFDYARGSLGECNTTLTTQENATSPLSIGTGQVSSGTDTATLTITGVSTWGGTLTWYLCGPVSTDACDAHGVQVTSRTVSNNSPASAFVSDTATLTSAGRYCWHAHFEPDATSAAAGVKPGDDNGANECFTVNPVTPTLTTLAACTHTPCVLGVDTLSDTATLTGTATQPGTNGPGGDTGLYKSINAATVAPADNSISWTLFGPTHGGCTDTKTLNPSSATVSGDGTYGPVTYTPVLSDGLGTYTFVASYPGNSPNTGAATPTSCPDTSGTETITVIGSASSTSAQRWLPNDRVVLSTTGGTLNGTLTVTLYSGTFSGTAGDCTAGSATAVPGQQYTFNPSGDASGTAYNTSNATFYVGTKPDGTAGGAAGSYFWLVHYNDNNLTDPPDRCESSNVTITDG